MTKSGIWFIVAGILVYFLASQTQIGWLYLFDAIIWGLLIFSAVISWHTVRGLQVERQVLLPRSIPWQLNGPVEDGSVEVRLKLANRGRLGRHFVRLIEECPFEQTGKQNRAFFIATVKSMATEAFTYQATCYRRGYYPSATVTIECGGPLGLVVRKRTFLLPLNLTVYPKYYQMEGMPAAETAWAEQGRHLKSSAADEFYGSREYRFGDPLRHIHWRNTARLGQFMLKEFEQSRQGTVAVAFETGRELGTGRETTLEYSIRVAASLARLAADLGRTIDIFAGQNRFSAAGWQEAMDFLARMEAGGEGSLADVANIASPYQSMAVIVSAADIVSIPALLTLSRRVRKLMVVLLEGFAPDEYTQEFHNHLKGANLEIITCAWDGLEPCVRELGKSLRESESVTAVG